MFNNAIRHGWSSPRRTSFASANGGSGSGPPVAHQKQGFAVEVSAPRCPKSEKPKKVASPLSMEKLVLKESQRRVREVRKRITATSKGL